ncbi:MAG: AMP-binding protein [Christensenellales bacterium]
MNLVDRFLDRTDFKDYEDFRRNGKLKVPEKFNFAYDVIDEYARLAPDKKAILWCNDKGEEKVITFKELSLLANKAANVLKSRGLKKGDIIMTMLNRRWEYWVTVIACHKAGIVIIPATFLLTPKDIEYRIKGAGAKCLIATNEEVVLENIDNAKKSLPEDMIYFTTGDRDGYADYTAEMQDASDEWERVETDLNDESMVYFTSGTTGYPKMVAHNFLYPLGFIYNAVFWHKVKDDGLHFTASESGWAKCSWGKLYGQWIAGACLFIYDYLHKFKPTDLLERIEKYRIDTFCAPPTIYRYLIKEDLSKYDLSPLSHCSTAGEALNPEVFRQFYAATGQKIYEGYGQTETSIILGTFCMMDIKEGSMGKPSPLYDLHLVDEDMNDVQPGVVGEIVIKIHQPQCSLIYKYHNSPELTEERLGDGYHHTGDLAYYDEDGYFWFIGRTDDVIKSSGYRIGPFEVESALMEHPAVLECAITGVPDEQRGQIIKATIVLAKGYEPSDALIKELQNHVKTSTAPYKYPRVVEFVNELPKTISGKIKRAEIRKQN